MPGSRISSNVGKTGSGKTTIALERYWSWDRSVALDSKLGGGDGEFPGWPVSTLRELEATLERFRKEGREKWRISYRGPLQVKSAQPDKVLDAEPLFQVLQRFDNYLLIVEEASKVCTSRSAPPSLLEMAFRGRHRGQALTINTQRPSLVAKDLLSQSELYIVWPLQDRNDRATVRSWGFDLDVMDGLEARQSLRLLAPEGELPEFYVCRCSRPHSEVCGNPLPRKGDS